LSHLGSGERNLATAKAHAGRANGRERVNVAKPDEVPPESGERIKGEVSNARPVIILTILPCLANSVRLAGTSARRTGAAAHPDLPLAVVVQPSLALHAIGHPALLADGEAAGPAKLFNEVLGLVFGDFMAKVRDQETDELLLALRAGGRMSA